MTEPLLSSKHAGVNRYRSLEPKERKGSCVGNTPAEVETGHPMDDPHRPPKTRVCDGVGVWVPTCPPTPLPPTIAFMGGRGSWARIPITPTQTTDTCLERAETVVSGVATGLAAPHVNYRSVATGGGQE